ncbi:hypothetical protein VNO77_27019 [Canavalia gladiata]|uniref:Uncharacterized protein n=1 Tax=Canavalia gladiata TaxID=3824 RepID=A0AAN9KW65_CANGL
MISQLFVFHKSKNFTSDYEIRMPPIVPVNHYSDPEGQHNKIRILWCYPMLIGRLELCFGVKDSPPKGLWHGIISWTGQRVLHQAEGVAISTYFSFKIQTKRWLWLLASYGFSSRCRENVENRTTRIGYRASARLSDLSGLDQRTVGVISEIGQAASELKTFATMQAFLLKTEKILMGIGSPRGRNLHVTRENVITCQSLFKFPDTSTKFSFPEMI